jgi:cysteine desulfurase
VVTAATEHPAVLASMDVLRDEGFAITVLPVDGEGRIALADFIGALRPETILASLMLANNELGTLNPIADFARAARARGVVFHTDAVQAAGRVALDVTALDVDLMTLSAHKCYGPKGVGLLFVRSGTPLVPVAVGGGQEAGLRAGTENVAGIVGFARALELANAERPNEAARLAVLRDRLESGILAKIPGARINSTGAARLPNLSSVAFAGVDVSALLVRLDLEGAAASAGSACAAGSTEPSHVIAALGAPDWVEAGTIRLSLGRLTHEQDVAGLLQLLPAVVAGVRVGQPDLGTAYSGSPLDRSEVRS